MLSGLLTSALGIVASERTTGLFASGLIALLCLLLLCRLSSCSLGQSSQEVACSSIALNEALK